MRLTPAITARALLGELCRQLGVKVRGSIHELIEVCVRELRDSGRLLMVDEAELLPYRALRFCAVCMTSGYRDCSGGYAAPCD
ncbi:hypothetical protein [Escherichia coli]|uniref:hypothetical protein n=1 Tax=Escherichia coli TaxID=562 RepID=UPI002FCD1B81